MSAIDFLVVFGLILISALLLSTVIVLLVINFNIKNK